MSASVWCDLSLPSAVNCAASGRFMHDGSICLVVSRSSMLQLFRVISQEKDEGMEYPNEEDPEISGNLIVEEGNTFNVPDVHLQLSRRRLVSHLQLVAEVGLYGTITSMSPVVIKSIKRASKDYLLVSFKSAKVSLLEWNPEEFSWSTVSIHYYEQEEFCSPLSENPPECFLVQDPNSRCGLLKFYEDMLAIIPFRQADTLDLMDLDELHAKSGLEEKDIPFYSSFVLEASKLDESIHHIQDIKFLHEYQEPTLAILYEPHRTNSGLLKFRQDTKALVVVTIDLQQKASTSIFSVTQLPSDIFSLCALPSPIGGCILLGANEIVHVDPAGRPICIAVNAYAKLSSLFRMESHEALQLCLEGAIPIYLPKSPYVVLVITRQGEMLRLNFKMNGRSVSSMIIERVLLDDGGDLIQSGINTALTFGENSLFLTSLIGDSMLLGWRKEKDSKVEDVQSKILFSQVEDPDELDHIYGDGGTTQSSTFSADDHEKIIFRLHDSLPNSGPILDFSLGRQFFRAEDKPRQKNAQSDVELISISGANLSGALSIHKNSIVPQVHGRFDFPECQGLWTVRVRNRTINAISREKSQIIDDEFDSYLIISTRENSLVFTIGQTFEEVTASEFDSAGSTLAVSSILNDTRIVQVCQNDIRLYDPDTPQLLPLYDLENDVEVNIVFASVADPYVFLILENGNTAIFIANFLSKELEEVEKPQGLFPGRTITGCLYAASTQDLSSIGLTAKCSASGTANNVAPQGADTEENRITNISVNELNVSNLSNSTADLTHLCLSIDDSGVLLIVSLPEWKLIGKFNDFAIFPSLLTISHDSDAMDIENRRNTLIAEISLSPLGPVGNKELFFLVRTEANDIIIYKPFSRSLYSNPSSSEKEIAFRKVRNSRSTRSPLPDEGDHLTSGVEKGYSSDSISKGSRFLNINDVSGYHAVFIAGRESHWILKDTKSIPRLFPFASKHVRGLSPCHTAESPHGVIYSDDKDVMRIAQIPSDFRFDNQMTTRKISLGRNVHAITYHSSQEVYVLSSSTEVSFELHDEEGQPIADREENDQLFLPAALQGSLELISPANWSTIDKYEFASNEYALCVKSVNLEISEHSKARKPYIACGTGVFRGEDLAMRGKLYLFETIGVVPEPGRPETNLKLKLIYAEEVKGAITSLCDISGYLLSIQGQKMIIRGLEDGDHLVGVAFLDLRKYTKTVKCLGNLILIGDFDDSVILVGFTFDPYKLTVFGKDVHKLSVVCADFLVDNGSAYISVSDADGVLRLLQYDPENPNSLSGHRLVPKADFNTGTILVEQTMTVKMPLERKPVEEGEEAPENDPYQYLDIYVAVDGSIHSLCPVSERKYRRLYLLHNLMVNSADHLAGLNPRSYRAPMKEQKDRNIMKGILDGQLLLDFLQLSEDKKQTVAKKLGIPLSRLLDDMLELDRSISYL
ncbi:Protein cft1 [Neolecta irregularis DAH-3]|uniref:Protein cft1 n=1 Tax=Neolecta irregularis (strain DAH-3) TaxID=1198029 RepID=A0A1U7LJY7_NEOID|nr:Protein cft1 [Neolecta irregularis DAH-3]|eukprot:OLL22967.1 Protein cft1 [Neolecta irregularis DAH-3]